MPKHLGLENNIQVFKQDLSPITEGRELSRALVSTSTVFDSPFRPFTASASRSVRRLSIAGITNAPFEAAAHYFTSQDRIAFGTARALSCLIALQTEFCQPLHVN